MAKQKDSEQSNRLVIAITSSALFDLKEGDAVFRKQGLPAYRKYQIKHEDKALVPGCGFPLVEKLLHLNNFLTEGVVEVILLSKNTADTGLRVLNSIQHHKLGITKAAFSGGESPHRYAAAFNCHLFLSTDKDDVRMALNKGVAAANLLIPSAQQTQQTQQTQLRIAFDGDAVLFSDEAERIYQDKGLHAFQEAERAKAHTPLPAGPFQPFLKALHGIQTQCDKNSNSEKESPIRTALVTARSAPAHERVIRTFRAWDVRLDECLFLGGKPKAEFLKAFAADVFFDDQMEHCVAVNEHLQAGHVVDGVANEEVSEKNKLQAKQK